MPNSFLDKIFVGSTSKDLDAYRLAVSDALFQRVGLSAHLSEDWDTDHNKTVEECRTRLEAMHGYFGIFAYYYGWIPDGNAESITHLEYLWAMEKWGDKRPARLAVFMPGFRHASAAEGPCPAEKELKASAEMLVEDYPQGREFHASRLLDFHSLVRSRTVNFFQDRHELRELAITTGFRWKGSLFSTAGETGMDSGAGADRSPTDEQFGTLGRERQIEAVRDLVSLTRTLPSVPALAMLAYGGEEYGQKEFLEALEHLEPLCQGRPPVNGRPPLPRYNLDQLFAWMGNMLCAAQEGESIDTLDDLADALYRLLRKQSAVLLVNRIGGLYGGVECFSRDLWSPLFERLSERCRAEPVSQRLIVVIAVHRRWSPEWNGVVTQWNPDQEPENYGKVVALPELGDIRRNRLRRWLTELGVADTPPGNLQQIIETVLKDGEGNDDAIPVRVYRRIRDQQLWPEGG